MTGLLAFPFMQRALVAGLVLGTLLSLIGIFVVLRRMAFFSDGIAHASLAGAALGLLTKTDPLFVSIGFSALFGALISYIEKRTKLSSDAVIGLIFTTGMATGIILLSLGSGYRPELSSFLFGDILSLQWSEIALMSVLALDIAIFILLRYKRLALLILNEELAYVDKIPTGLYRTALYMIIAVTVVLGMKMLGIILVSALLIIPVSTAKLLAKSFSGLMLLSVIAADVTVLLGLFASVALNLPASACIILCGMALFLLTALASRIPWFSRT